MNVSEYHELLNKQSIVPTMSYRRNSKYYELICYINNTIACYLSGNEKAAQVFIERSCVFMSENEPTNDVASYYELVFGYLTTLENELN